MRKLMLILTVILMSKFLMCCAPVEKASVPVWHFEDHAACEMNLDENIQSLPFDLALSLNRSDLQRYDSYMSLRPWVISEALETKDLSEGLIDADKQGQTGFTMSSWSLDGNSAYLNKNWIEPQHAMLEESKQQFILTPEAYRTDIIRVKISNLSSENISSVNEISYFSTGAGLNAHLPGKIIFSAMVNGEMKSFTMNQDGSNKQPLQSTSGYSYGLSISPDGTKYAFHSEYKIYIGDFQSGLEKKVETPCAFNFGPIWSPNSQRIVFSCGATSVAPDLYTADKNGNDVRFLASRNGYEGVVAFMDGFDYHGGGTDRFVWLADSSGVVHGKKIDQSIELVASKLDGSTDRLTFTQSGSINVYPGISSDGRYLVFNSKRVNNIQNTYYIDLQTKLETRITDLDQGCSSRIGQWKPQ